MNRFLGCLVVFAASYVAFLASARAQTATVIPANEAAGRINQYATVKQSLQKCSPRRAEKRSSISASLIQIRPLPVGYPASPVSKSAVLSNIEGKHVKIPGRIELYRRKPEIRINVASQLEIE
jgi:hypothetical protein